MNSRELFLEVMNFNPKVRTLKWEYAYWGGTLDRWYSEGLPKKYFVQLPEKITSPTSSLYLYAFKQNQHVLDSGHIPEGLAVFGNGVYWPTQGLPLEHDVEEYLGLDKGVRLVDVNLLFYPMFEPKTISEDEKYFTYLDIDGCVRVYQKKESTLPHTKEWILTGPESWKKLKAERLRPEDFTKRLPENWDQLVQEYKNRDYPLSLGGYPYGFFGLLAHLMGYEQLFLAYYDEPEMVKDILNTFTDMWIEIYSVILDCVEVDMCHIFEDISMGAGPMVSVDIFREFMLPCYKRLTSFLKRRGVKNILVDTDGDCSILIPHLLEGGVTGLYPMEVSAGMDIVKTRKNYPELCMMGGIPKMEIANGPAAIDPILENVKELLKYGGYIPFLDHSVPPNVSWKNFEYYRTRLNEIIEAASM
jgi:uroporphyrinogen-III decarboxylase